jgi:hypothetical protein
MGKTIYYLTGMRGTLSKGVGNSDVTKYASSALSDKI